MDVIPSLTVEGFITNKRTQISKIVEYFLASDKSQSNTFYGKVYSLKGILQEYSSPSDISSAIKSQLTEMCLHHFDSVEVLTDVSEDMTHRGVYNIKVDIIGRYGEEIITLSKELPYSMASTTSFDSQLLNLYKEKERDE